LQSLALDVELIEEKGTDSGQLPRQGGTALADVAPAA